MRYVIREKLFHLTEDFTITNESGVDIPGLNDWEIEGSFE